MAHIRQLVLGGCHPVPNSLEQFAIRLEQTADNLASSRTLLKPSFDMPTESWHVPYCFKHIGLKIFKLNVSVQ
jgi:hypothetical protein